MEEKIAYMKEYNNKEIFNKIISYDIDGVMLWHGKRWNLLKKKEKKWKIY